MRTLSIVYLNAITEPEIAQDLYEGVYEGLKTSRDYISGKKRFVLHNVDIFRKNRPGEMTELCASLNPDAIILSGSEMSMVEPLAPWSSDYLKGLRQLIAWIQNSNQKKIPLLGICFGHQALAKVYGSEIICTHKMRIGSVKLNLQSQPSKHFGEFPFTNETTALNFIVYHEDVVKELPEDFELDLSLNEVPIYGMHHRELPIFSIQAHPEMRKSTKVLSNDPVGWSKCADDEFETHAGPKYLGAFYDYI